MQFAFNFDNPYTYVFITKNSNPFVVAGVNEVDNTFSLDNGLLLDADPISEDEEGFLVFNILDPDNFEVLEQIELLEY